jgi:hypothetical protein
LIVATNFSVDFRKYITYFQISLECGHLFLWLAWFYFLEPAQDLLAELGLTASLSALIEVRLAHTRRFASHFETNGCDFFISLWTTRSEQNKYAYSKRLVWMSFPLILLDEMCGIGKILYWKMSSHTHFFFSSIKLLRMLIVITGILETWSS